MQLYHGVSRATVPEAEAERIERAPNGVAAYDLTREIAARAGRMDGGHKASHSSSTPTMRNASLRRQSKPFSLLSYLEPCCGGTSLWFWSSENRVCNNKRFGNVRIAPVLHPHFHLTEG